TEDHAMKQVRWRVRHVLWLVAAVLLVAGVHATRARAAQQPPPQRPAVDTTAAAAPDALAVPARVQDSIASGVGSGTAPLTDTLTAAAPPARDLRDLRTDIDTPFHARLVSLLGMFVLLLLGWALSVDRR